MMCARSVTRSSSALHKRGFGNTFVHSENGKFVVKIGAEQEFVQRVDFRRFQRAGSFVSSYCASRWELNGKARLNTPVGMAGISRLQVRGGRGSQDIEVVGAQETRPSRVCVFRLRAKRAYGHCDLGAGGCGSGLLRIPDHGGDRGLSIELCGVRAESGEDRASSQQGAIYQEVRRPGGAGVRECGGAERSEEHT